MSMHPFVYDLSDKTLRNFQVIAYMDGNHGYSCTEAGHCLGHHQLAEKGAVTTYSRAATQLANSKQEQKFVKAVLTLDERPVMQWERTGDDAGEVYPKTVRIEQEKHPARAVL